jgi:ABC-2 type transport system ATP-binding protein
MALEIIIGNLKAKKKTIFISSHILAPLLNICDEIHLLQEGVFIKNYTKENFNDIEKELFKNFNETASELIKNSI